VNAQPFQPTGSVSVVEVCMKLIVETAEKDGIDYAVALTEVRGRTGRDDVTMRTVINSMRVATERLHRIGTPGMVNIGKAWQRLDPPGMVGYIAARDRRGRRQFRRAMTAVAATDRDRLAFADRHALDHHERTARTVSELERRRTTRQRPPALGAS